MFSLVFIATYCEDSISETVQYGSYSLLLKDIKSLFLFVFTAALLCRALWWQLKYLLTCSRLFCYFDPILDFLVFRYCIFSPSLMVMFPVDPLMGCTFHKLLGLLECAVMGQPLILEIKV